MKVNSDHIDKRTGIWSTADEKAFIKFLASTTPRGSLKRVPTLKERIARVKAWLNTYDKRRWGQKIEVEDCYHYARSILIGLNQDLEAIA